jgi:hypothetical protein
MPRPWNKIQSLWDSSFFDIELKLTILMPPNSKKKKKSHQFIIINFQVLLLLNENYIEQVMKFQS